MEVYNVSGMVRSKSSVAGKPAKWMVPKRRGIVPDVMVQTRLLSFVGKYPNLGVMGGGNNNVSGESFKSFELKTASCQSGSGIMDLSGIRRFLELGDNVPGGQPRKGQKRQFLPGNSKY